VICRIDGQLLGARSLTDFHRRLATVDLSTAQEFTMVDANGHAWMLLAPSFIIRPMRKLEIIRLFNESRTAQEKGLRYPESVIPNRRLDTIVGDLAKLLTARRNK
jgi:hypothetical protein